tara:strand:+ start:1099 stop:1284 length:186 start_codon:yes stop_codon:yes gene_type:complete
MGFGSSKRKETKMKYYEEDENESNEYLMHPGGSLEERYQVYCDLTIQCGEDPVSFDEWLNS